ncbi:MAG: four helix bundle protein [Candidatus Gracilibacteria bacterium]|nr:four helix bundle protein [Candidatus Gracilibacteria bacterium]
MIHSYKDLEVWKRAMTLTEEVYEITASFPTEEKYGLTSQIRRSALSIPSNIAEGRYRFGKKDFVRFLRYSYSSGAELGTQIELSKRLAATRKLDYSKVDELLEEVMKMLNVMINKLIPRTYH